jgi:hypothetical protein
MIENQIPREWSPHLHPDMRHNKARRSKWKAPSMDETYETLFSRRNIQIYSFCLGFVFPLGKLYIYFLHPLSSVGVARLVVNYRFRHTLAWLIASFLPLPSKVCEVHQEATTGRPDLEQNAFENRVVLMDEMRYENARWWRNLNRCMMPLGVGVIATVVSCFL